MMQTSTKTTTSENSQDSKTRVEHINDMLCELQRKAEMRRIANQYEKSSKSLREEFFEGINVS